MYLSIGQAALLIRVSVYTLRRWELDGFLSPHHRTAGKHSRYASNDLDKYLGIQKLKRELCIAYSRVFSHEQKADRVRFLRRKVKEAKMGIIDSKAMAMVFIQFR